MNSKKKIILLSILVLLGIGFAAVATNLNINGTVSINGNASNFQVIYDTTYIENKAISKVNGLEYNETNPVYNSNTSMTFSPSNGLLAVGDYYEVSYNILNNSTMYGALVNIECGSGSDGSGDLTPFSYSGDIENIQISPQGNKEGKIKFSYATESSTDATLSFTCKVTASALSTDATGAIVDTGVKLSSDPLAIYNIVKSKVYSYLDQVYVAYNIDKADGYDIDKVYYYNGSYTSLKNNIIFNNMCWKIIRTTETGGTKIIYNGVPTDGKCETQTGENTQIGTSAFNPKDSDNAYVGYMYGTVGASAYADTHENKNESTIKKYIDAWYKTNFVDSNSSEAAKLEDTVFCNDRSLDTGYEAAGYGKSLTHYSSYSRSSFNASSPSLSLKCANKNDKFTLKSNGNSALNGNNALTYPVGLITLDEARFAGLTSSTNSLNYLNTKQVYWVLTPEFFYYGYASVGTVLGNGRIYDGVVYGDDVGNALGVRPVVSLKNSVTVTGDGSTTSPYVVQ